MAAVPPICDFGWQAPDFRLPATDGKTYALSDIRGETGTLIMFICNHCPYVIHLRKELVKIANRYQKKGVAFIAINSNDTEQYPADSPEKMADVAKQGKFTFPYLFDEDQSVAKTYRAACTPDFYVFDRNCFLAYRGQFDDSRPGNDVLVTGSDLCSAIDATLDGERILDDVQTPSIGCNIKWKPGNAPEYFG